MSRHFNVNKYVCRNPNEIITIRRNNIFNILKTQLSKNK